MEYFSVDLDCPQLKGEVQLLGTLIYQLDKQLMDCIFPIWAIVAIALSSLVAVIIVIVMNRKWETIKFFMFMHFDILPNDDGPENLDEMEFDAFVTYRYIWSSYPKINCFLFPKISIYHPQQQTFQRIVRRFTLMFSHQIVEYEFNACNTQLYTFYTVKLRFLMRGNQVLNSQAVRRVKRLPNVFKKSNEGRQIQP